MSKNKYNDLIGALQDINKNNTLSVYVPSLARSVDFNPITVQQQKSIISTALESSLNTMAFSIVSYEIIKACCVEDDLTFYSIDRNPILIGLRSHMLGFNATGQTNNGEERSINIEEHFKQYNKIKPAKNLLGSRILKYDDISIVFKPPTLEEDVVVSKRARKVVDKLIGNDSITDTIGEVIVYELIKYIKTIEISDRTLDFNYNDSLQLVKVVEQLPLKLSKMILTEVNRIKRFEDKFLVVPNTKEKISIIVDARFFNGE